MLLLRSAIIDDAGHVMYKVLVKGNVLNIIIVN